MTKETFETTIHYYDLKKYIHHNTETNDPSRILFLFKHMELVELSELIHYYARIFITHTEVEEKMAAIIKSAINRLDGIFDIKSLRCYMINDDFTTLDNVKFFITVKVNNDNYEMNRLKLKYPEKFLKIRDIVNYE